MSRSLRSLANKRTDPISLPCSLARAGKYRDSRLNRPESVSLASLARQLFLLVCKLSTFSTLEVGGGGGGGGGEESSKNWQILNFFILTESNKIFSKVKSSWRLFQFVQLI